MLSIIRGRLVMGYRVRGAWENRRKTPRPMVWGGKWTILLKVLFTTKAR